MVNLTFIFHSLMMYITSLIIIIIIILLIKDWEKFKSLDNYKVIVLLSSLTIAISSHEIVYYNYIKNF
jgi:positive regulator of sigma E activity